MEVRPDWWNEMKRSFFQAAVVSILLSGCTTWTLTKRVEKKLDGNYTSNIEQVLAATPHKAPTIRPPASLHDNYPSLTNKTCRTLLEKQRRAHKWYTPMDPHIWPGKIRTTSSNIPLCEDTGYSSEDLPEAMNGREKWRERVRDIGVNGTTWWWWWWLSICCKQFNVFKYCRLKLIIQLSISHLFTHS